MEDYKELYLEMMCASEKAIRILIEAQKKCEDQIIGEETIYPFFAKNKQDDGEKF